MKILVTGGRGTIGTVLCPMLESRGHEVEVYDIVNGRDIRNESTLEGPIRNADMVIHMAAAVGRINGENSVVRTIASNMEGTAIVASLCARNKKRLINFSTSEVYGDLSTPDVLAQNNVYGLTKLAAEGLVEHLRRWRKLKAINVRPFMVYGPPEKPNGQLRSAISNFVQTLMDGENITVHAGSERAWLFVDDFCEALCAIVENFDTLHTGDTCAYDIASKDYRNMADISHLLCKMLGSGGFAVVPHPGLGTPIKVSNDDRIYEWWDGPKVPLEEGLQRVIDWQMGV